MSKLSTSKWTKYKIMRKDAKLLPHLPKTKWLRESSLWRMLDKYDQVIIKPTGSYGGHGVIRIKRLAGGTYQVHNGANKKTYQSKSALNAYIHKYSKKTYLVQQRIPLATVKGRPFDLRVMVQRSSRKAPWQVTGKLAKVAGKGFIVTNVRRSSGKVVSVEHVLNHSALKSMSRARLLEKMDKVALDSARQLDASYPWVHTMGIDMGLDHDGNVWVIEVNFAPMLGLFLKLKNKSMFRKIKSFSKK
ncbi:YheC/YheD family protein [Paenibacillus aestuarii]|uniref:YheC/YheD family protein n=1 Tax=Paenibacillus aestuarii TaxID=516965 RepID=A0ABW0K3U3_9BACL|nr:YheC/YheD family protein [Paenibacillus aestuarii]